MDVEGVVVGGCIPDSAAIIAPIVIEGVCVLGDHNQLVNTLGVGVRVPPVPDAAVEENRPEASGVCTGGSEIGGTIAIVPVVTPAVVEEEAFADTEGSLSCCTLLSMALLFSGIIMLKFFLNFFPPA